MEQRSPYLGMFWISWMSRIPHVLVVLLHFLPTHGFMLLLLLAILMLLLAILMLLHLRLLTVLALRWLTTLGLKLLAGRLRLSILELALLRALAGLLMMLLLEVRALLSGSRLLLLDSVGAFVETELESRVNYLARTGGVGHVDRAI